LRELKKDYTVMCAACFELASSSVGSVYDNKGKDTKAFSQKLTPDRAIYEIEPAIKGLLLSCSNKNGLNHFLFSLLRMLQT